MIASKYAPYDDQDMDTFATVSDSFEGDCVIVIDNFENYSDDLILNLMYDMLDTGSKINISVDTEHFGSGSQGARITFSLRDGAVCGLLSTQFSAKWNGAKTFHFWMDADLIDRYTVVQFKEQNGEYWEAYYPAESAGPTFVKIPIEAFGVPSWNTSGDGIMDLSNITKFNFYVSLRERETPIEDAVIYVDDFKVLNGSYSLPALGDALGLIFPNKNVTQDKTAHGPPRLSHRIVR